MDLLQPSLWPGLAAEIGVTILAKGGLVVMAASLLAGLTRRGSAATRYALWMGALCGLLVLPLAPLVVPGMNLGWVESPALPGFGASVEQVDVQGRAAEGGTTSAWRSLAPGASLPGWTLVGGSLLAVWAAGALALLGRLALDWVRVVRITRRGAEDGTRRDLTRRAIVLARRQGVQRRIRVVLSHEMHVPVTWGIWRPVVILPPEALSWPPGHLDAVLLHELAHVRRWDYPTHLLSEAARAVYWPNPLAWMALRRSRIERERACDDAVLRFGTESSDYARLLLELARSLSSSAPVVRGAMAMARPSMLETRINGVLDGRSDHGPAARWRVAAAGLLLAAVMAPIGSVRVWASPPSTETEWIEALGRRDAVARLAAIDVLEALASAGAVDALGAILDDRDARIRHAAVGALGRIADPRAVPALVGVVTGTHGDLHQKRLAASALGGIDDRAALDALAGQLDGRAPESRRSRVRSAEGPDASVWQPLVQVLLKDPRPEARSLAAAALVDIGCEAAIPELLAATRDRSAAVRLAAVAALGHFDTYDVRRTMARLAEEDPDAGVRKAASDALECDG